MRSLGAHTPDLVALHPVNVQPSRMREPTMDSLMLPLPHLPLPVVVVPCARPGFSVQERRRNRKSPAATMSVLPSGRGRSWQQPGRGQPCRVPSNSQRGRQVPGRALVPQVAAVPVCGVSQRAALSAMRVKYRNSYVAALHAAPVAKAAT